MHTFLCNWTREIAKYLSATYSHLHGQRWFLYVYERVHIALQREESNWQLNRQRYLSDYLTVHVCMWVFTHMIVKVYMYWKLLNIDIHVCVSYEWYLKYVNVFIWWGGLGGVWVWLVYKSINCHLVTKAVIG